MGRNDPGTGLGLDNYQGDTLRDKSTPEQLAAAKRLVRRLVSPELWHDNPAADELGIYDALFTEPGPARYHGDKPSQVWILARREWLDRCRAWCAGQGRPRSTSWVPAEEQRAYAEATGDVWVPPARKAAA